MGNTRVDHSKVKHTISELTKLYNSRVTKPQYLQMNTAIKGYEFKASKSDIPKFADKLRAMNRNIKLLNYYLQDIESSFKNASRYNSVALKVAKGKYGKFGKNNDKIRNKLLKLGYTEAQIAIIMRMAKNPNALKVTGAKSTAATAGTKAATSDSKSFATDDNNKSDTTNDAKDPDPNAELKQKYESVVKKESEASEKLVKAEQENEALKNQHDADQREINDLKNKINEKSGSGQTETQHQEPSRSSSSDSGGDDSAVEDTSSGDDSGTESPKPSTSDTGNTDIDDTDSEKPEGDSSDDDTIEINDKPSTSSNSRSSHGGSVIPAVLGVGAAGAAGFAGVRYIKNKNKDNYSEENYDDEEGSEEVDYSYSDDNNGEDSYSEEKYSADKKNKDHMSVDGDTIKINDDSNSLSLDEDEEIKIEDDYQDDFNEELE